MRSGIEIIGAGLPAAARRKQGQHGCRERREADRCYRAIAQAVHFVSPGCDPVAIAAAAPRRHLKRRVANPVDGYGGERKRFQGSELSVGDHAWVGAGRFRFRPIAIDQRSDGGSCRRRLVARARLRVFGLRNGTTFHETAKRARWPSAATPPTHGSGAIHASDPRALTPRAKNSARTQARRAGRPYPNLVDNMRAAAGQRRRRKIRHAR